MTRNPQYAARDVRPFSDEADLDNTHFIIWGVFIAVLSAVGLFIVWAMFIVVPSAFL